MSSVIDLESEMISMTLNFYNNPVIPRNVVQIFVDSLIDFVQCKLMTLIKNLMSSQQFNDTQKVVNFLNRIDLYVNNIFEKFKNEHNRFFTYSENNLMIEPI